MDYNIADILNLPVAEQKEIAKAILDNLKEINNDDVVSPATETELDKRFAKIDSGNFHGYSLEEVKSMLTAKWKKE
jgi:putative addiction module component (TIGR02574 family)